MSGATTNSSIINLLNTIIGAGLLALPYALRTDGLVLGMVILLLSAIGAGYGFFLQGVSSKYLPPGEASFFNVCQITYPDLAVVFDIAIAIQCFGVGLSYLVLTGDLMPHIIPIENLPIDERIFWILVSTIFIVPTSFLKKLDSLRYTSVVALLAIVYLVAVIYGNYLQGLLTNWEGFPERQPISVWKPQSFKAISSTFSIVVLAYTGHQNFYQITNELSNPTLRNLLKINLVSTIISYLIFVTVALAGYLTFGNYISGNIMLIYPDTIITRLGQSLLVLMVILSYPLMIFPARISFNNIYEAFLRRTTRSETEAELEAESEVDPLLPRSAQEVTISGKRFTYLTVFLLFLSYFLAITIKKFELVLSIVGAVGSTSISYTLPGFFGFKLLNSKNQDISKLLRSNNNATLYGHPVFHSPVYKYCSLALGVFGIVAMVVCLYSAVSK
ncbi:Putative transporter [Komagataella phaffii CBS 7435]|uniref:Vacuolar amino acid transporter, exports aspartate and glutamate from the vacuole n=2 Tax=Komagataella phaffii TaxID=460519 RepID=C4R2K4_KOMPG|nr:Vacuolar amino acid transporter, exports aspartate and glutamate from the vacuole [Komagataella phaffii GS115]AOA62863.1 GQ67_01146T0 [Komagataella phaffii]CAH2447717.1 Putative transporter [Komagataella phaffii CBS 7435]AOA68011.1 GQ68_00243T0 [Komagataella phaffii GS115]CAY69728.1 Vacuolar amino acid transporter, exports aspartate and glutamate from the vacuole [Komagataella phaffii GS115]CCA37898.1 Putative transporter [Komagataella phaffii CBS 7435]